MTLRSTLQPFALAATVLLAGCASFSADSGMLTVQEQAGGMLGKEVIKIRTEEEAAEANARVKALLMKPMTADAAVQIALLNNRALQAAYNDLGISEAQMVEASLPPSPTITLSRLAATGELEIERQLLQNVLGLLTLPRRREIAEDRFRQAQVRAVEATLRTAVETKRAYTRAIAANQTVKILEEARLSAEAVSDLAKQLGETGALSKADQTREHAFYAEVAGQLALARLKQRAAKNALSRSLGLWGSDANYRLPEKLKALPASPHQIANIETQAVLGRADLEIARMDLDILAKEYGLTERTRFIDVLEVSGRSKYERKPGPEKTNWRGVEAEFRIPIYDFGEARTRLAEEAYMQAVNRLIDKAVNVRSDARDAYQAYRGAYDIARHFEKEILPLREIISKEALLNYSGMLTDLFALLTDARARISANVQANEARRDFWLAAVDLDAAIVGGGTAGGTPEASFAAAAPGGGEAH